jgi:hypothetical protein
MHMYVPFYYVQCFFVKKKEHIFFTLCIMHSSIYYRLVS